MTRTNNAKIALVGALAIALVVTIVVAFNQNTKAKEARAEVRTLKVSLKVAKAQTMEAKAEVATQNIAFVACEAVAEAADHAMSAVSDLLTGYSEDLYGRMAPLDDASDEIDKVADLVEDAGYEDFEDLTDACIKAQAGI